MKYLLILIACFQINICSAQEFKFIPSSQHLLTDKEMETIQIIITPDVLLFTERGEILPQSQIELMANPDYAPLFYANNEGKIKSVVFKKKNEVPVLIEKNSESDYETGEKALDFIVKDLEGNTIKLSELRGKVVVLNFWFTRCGPCIQELPNLNNLTKEFESKNVEFLAITFNKKDLVEQFLEENSFDYKIAANANDVITMYGIESYPTSIVINKKGEIVLKESGYRTNIKSVLSNSIKSLLQ